MPQQVSPALCNIAGFCRICSKVLEFKMAITEKLNCKAHDEIKNGDYSTAVRSAVSTT
jgi:hypothetical protein